MQPVPGSLRVDRRAAPRDLRAAVRRLDSCLLVLVPYQRPVERLAPEVPHGLRTVRRQRTDDSGAGEEVVPRLDHTELIAFRIGEHHVPLLRLLPHVDVPAAELEGARHRGLLFLERLTGQIEVHLVRTIFHRVAGDEPDAKPGVVVGQQVHAFAGVLPDLPPQDSSPEPRQPVGIVRIEGQRVEVDAHSRLRSAGPPEMPPYGRLSKPGKGNTPPRHNSDLSSQPTTPRVVRRWLTLRRLVRGGRRRCAAWVDGAGPAGGRAALSR